MKLLSLTLLSILFRAVLFSQDSSKVKKGREIYVDLQPVIALVGYSSMHVTNQASDLFDNSIAPHWTLQLGYKHRNKKDKAWRTSAALRIYPQINDYNTETDSSFSSSEGQLILALGHEWQKGKGNWKYFFGSDLVYYYSTEMRHSAPEDLAIGTQYRENYDSHELGLSGFIGGQCKISNHFILNSTLKIGAKNGVTQKTYTESTYTTQITEEKRYSTTLNSFYEFNVMLGYQF